MVRLKQVGRYLTACSVVLLSIGVMQSCSIKMDPADCMTDPVMLVVKVIDVVTGRDITETGELRDASLYLFDRDGTCVKIYNLTASRIKEREPVVITDFDPRRMMISAWGNIGSPVNFSEIEEGDRAEDLKVSLKRDPRNPDYDQAPNDFFFGYHEMDRTFLSDGREEVVLTQKNAKLHITVEGLKNVTEDNLYFQIANQYNGYNFRGAPLRVSSSIKEKGFFNKAGAYVSEQPHLLIHSANQNQATPDNCVRIALYDENKELVKTDRDINGNYITLTSGKTTNVWIGFKDFVEEGQLEVYVVVTPWDEIHQWEIW